MPVSLYFRAQLDDLTHTLSTSLLQRALWEQVEMPGMVVCIVS